MSDDISGTLEEVRAKTAEHLNIDLSEPQQEKRIEALQKLYDRYVRGIDVKSLIYQDIIDCCEKLKEIHSIQQKSLDDLKVSDDSALAKKIKLRNIEYKFKGEIRSLEKKIDTNNKLLSLCDGKYSDFGSISVEHKKRLKRFEDRSWDNWLRALDVNKELRNTIIGFENRKALLKISNLYVDYYILSNMDISKCFEELKEQKKEGIKSYYEILSWYQLSLEKKIDFKVFLQKMIESKLSDSVEVKSIFGEFAALQRTQIDELIEEIRGQYQRDQEDMISVINYHKKYLLNKQVLFTNESESLILYFKRRYVEKIDLLCSRFQMYHSETVSEGRGVREKKFKLFKKLISDEFDRQLNQLKMKFSKKAIPFLDNFWHLEQSTENSYALDEMELSAHLVELKEAKNMGIKALIDEFESERNQLKESFERKLNIMEGFDDTGFDKFDLYLKDLKDECELLCCDLINANARFWTKTSAAFNCVLREYFVRLRHQYAPYIQSWRAGCKPWMNEYLQINLNQELLRAIGEALQGISPESTYYKKIADRLLRFNENVRSIMVKRDKIELEQLLQLNTLPTTDSESVREEAVRALSLRQDCYSKFLEDYNNFYKEQLSR